MCRESPNRPMIKISFQPFGARRCGDCQLCCRLLPIPTIDKPANKRCEHQSHARGCKIYSRRPFACSVFSCRWLTEEDTRELSRPDRAGYVIDPMPEYIRVQEESGTEHRIPVVQIWCDPRRRAAHRDPKLREYLDNKAQEGFAALIRYGPSEGFVLWAPSMSSDRCWHEQTGNHEPEHSIQEIISTL